MISTLPRFILLLGWILVGSPVPFIPLVFMVSIATAVLMGTAVVRRSFAGKTAALLGILIVMFVQGLFPVLFLGFGFPLKIAVSPVPVNPLRIRASHDPLTILSSFLGLALVLTVAGIFAALVAGLYVEFGRSKLPLSKSFLDVKFLDPPDALNETVRRLSEVASIEPPPTVLVDSGLPSAFTIRADHRNYIAISVGLLESLDENEVEACIAHEVAHLKNRDFLIRSVATLAKVALFTKPLSYLIEPAVYRAREFLADETAARLIGGTNALVSALSKLNSSELNRSKPIGSVYMCNLAGTNGLLKVFSKHPSLETRIETLRELRLN